MAKSNMPAKPAGRTGVTRWEDRLANYAKAAVEQEASVSTGQFISTKAGQLTYQGNPVKDNTLDVVVIDGILENTYYEGKYDPNNPAPPICYAFGRDDKEMKPHERSSKPQAKSCGECKWNQWESADEGRGKACKNTRRLALLPTTDMTAAGLKKMEAAFLRVPVTSVKGWAAYTRGVAALRHLPPFGVVTRIRTVPDPKNQFRMTFEHNGDIPEPLMETVVERHEAMREEIAFPYPEATEAAEKKPARNERSGRRKY